MTGAKATPQNLPEYRETVEEIQRIVKADAPWLLSTDEPLLTVFIGELCVYRRASAALAQMSPSGLLKKTSAQKVQVRRAKELGVLAGQLGLSAQGRFRLGLQAAKAEAIQVRPRRTEQHAREVGLILAQSGAIPGVRVIDTQEVEQPAEPDVEPTPEETSVADVVVPIRVEEAGA